ncbi:helix-turn-helix transcriptional regulator [Propionivibrio sp.]|uniref:helix-turn-helix domain-containing protein n=1 Tax=Propionivibrio sp. TaxID=2212460 RepID=UPI00260E1853|nr:helix-turn-helix transcriptional regulator [Propionivibrio sp.]
MKTANALQKFGQRIRAERKRLRISTVVAAEAARISRVTLHRIEHGEPTVALGMYFEAMEVLGLTFDVVPKGLAQEAEVERAPEEKTNAQKWPSTVSFRDCPQLKKVAWHVHGVDALPAKDALNLYERNWRHVDKEKMTAKERKVVDKLVKTYGNGFFLV